MQTVINGSISQASPESEWDAEGGSFFHKELVTWLHNYNFNIILQLCIVVIIAED